MVRVLVCSFLNRSVFFLYARGEEEEDFPTLRQSFVGGGGPDRFFFFLLVFSKKKAFKKPTLLLLRARERVFLFGVSLGFLIQERARREDAKERESSHRREREKKVPGNGRRRSF